MNVAWGRWASASGILFAVLFVVGVILGPANLPDGTDKQVLDFYNDSGNTTAAVIAAYALVVAGIVYAIFLVELSSRFPRTDRTVRNWATLSTTSGAIFVVLLMAAACLFASISGDIKFGDDPMPLTADAARYLPEAGYPLLMIGGMIAAGVHIVTATFAAPGLFPKWLSWTSIVFAVLLLASVLLVPMILFPIWTIIASIMLLRRPAPTI